MRMGALLAVDGGGTSTRCMIVDDENGTLADVTGGPCAISRGQHTALTSLYATLDHALREAVHKQCARSRMRLALKAACLGLSGVSTTDAGPLVQQAVMRFLQERGYSVPATEILVVSDSEIALAGALAGRPGIVLIVGTGAVAVGRDAQGGFFRADGWGWLLGDAGSGYAIGRSALRAAFASLDGRLAQTRLVSAIPAHFGATRLEELVPRAYFSTWGPGEVAALAKVVAQLADEGDIVCRQILQRAGMTLANTVFAVGRRLSFGAEADVSYQGSIIHKIPVLRQAVHDTLLQEAPGYRLLPPERDPVEGALLLAQGL
jgi:N-acetylglucosamine kinase-like BadF-type ATPase